MRKHAEHMRDIYDVDVTPSVREWLAWQELSRMRLSLERENLGKDCGAELSCTCSCTTALRGGWMRS